MISLSPLPGKVSYGLRRRRFRSPFFMGVLLLASFFSFDVPFGSRLRMILPERDVGRFSTSLPVPSTFPSLLLFEVLFLETDPPTGIPFLFSPKATF